ncbi:omptin family outer membrane protease [Treponema peruense]|uniref:Omptin family outer membrane protease n=1 Tax=Treponema peruense TaxID=2787628 RepID=A0A7T3V5H4_9SPIR|nr:omptin family outer membrane protease [Treponema peruense]QQA01466.1 omptin family outer membrane protease [Treponema peruense]
MKKVFFLLVFVLYANHYVSGISFQICPFSGFEFGNISELVYENNVEVSELEWTQITPYIGITTKINLWNFLFDFTIKNAIPVALGRITDKDFSNAGSSYVSLYSEHNLITDKDYLFDLNIVYLFKINKLVAGLGISGFYSNLKMEAVDGYLQYPDDNTVWTGTENKDYLNGTSISYEQQKFAGGFYSIVQTNLQKFNLAFSFNIYPFIKVDCIDNHFFRSIQFLDNMTIGYCYRVNVIADWKISKNCILFFSVDYFYLEAFGTTSINPLGQINYGTRETKDSNNSATNESNFNFKAGFKLFL